MPINKVKTVKEHMSLDQINRKCIKFQSVKIIVLLFNNIKMVNIYNNGLFLFKIIKQMLL